MSTAATSTIIATASLSKYVSTTVTNGVYPTALLCDSQSYTDGGVDGIDIGVGISPPTKGNWNSIVTCCNGEPIVIGGDRLDSPGEDGQYYCTAWCSATNATVKALNNCYYQPGNPVNGAWITCEDDREGGCNGGIGISSYATPSSTSQALSTKSLATSTTSTMTTTSKQGVATQVGVKSVSVVVLLLSVLVVGV